MGSHVKVLGLVETKDANGNARVEAKDADGNPLTGIVADIQMYKDHVPAISGFYFNQVGAYELPQPRHIQHN